MNDTESKVTAETEMQPSESMTTEETGSADTSTQETVSADETAAGDETTQKDEHIKELEKQIQDSMTQNNELKNALLRKQADFDNFRKRMQREKQESIKFANTNLLQDIITIIDDFERAIRSSEESKDFDSFHSGIKMIEKQFISMLERKYGLKRMETLGKEFDPQKHEAIGMEESSDVEVQTVLEDYQKGYVLNDRVIRHAKVKVAVPANPPSSDSDEEEQGKEEKEDA